MTRPWAWVTLGAAVALSAWFLLRADLGPLFIGLIAIYVLVLISIYWFIGLVELWASDHRAWVVVSVLGTPIGLGVLAYLGFVLPPRPGSKNFESADGYTRRKASIRYPKDYEHYLAVRRIPQALPPPPPSTEIPADTI